MRKIDYTIISEEEADLFLKDGIWPENFDERLKNKRLERLTK